MNAPSSNDARESEEVLEKELASEEDHSLSKAGESLKDTLASSSEEANTRRKRTVPLEKEHGHDSSSVESSADDVLEKPEDAASDDGSIDDAEPVLKSTDDNSANDDDESENSDKSEKEMKDDQQEDEIPPELEGDEEFKLAMEMAIAAAQNPHLSPAEIRKLVGAGEKNKQAEFVDEIAKKKEEELRKNRENSNGWFASAAKRAEAMKDRAERRMYADRIKNDEEILNTRRKLKILKKTIKAHRLQGNRVETRHVFKRQRMEKYLMQTVGKLTKTQRLFTHSSYNVQEYMKSVMKASKKWRKVGSDEELTLEAQLCRNMHQMLALEKQKVKTKKSTKELKKYLQRCKGWLSDKKAFCEMNLMTLNATQTSIMMLMEETIEKQDALILKLKRSDEFKDVDLSDVDMSNLKLPAFFDRESKMDAMKGLPISDSIRVKKEKQETDKDVAEKQHALEEAKSRQELVRNYYQAQKVQQQQRPEVYVETKDDVSVSSHLSDPDASFNNHDDSDSEFAIESDAPWMEDKVVTEKAEASSGDDKKPKAKLSDASTDTDPATTSSHDSPAVKA